MGSVINKADQAILLDILDPSGHIESEYRSYLVVTHTGRQYTGVLTSEAATSVTLRKEKGEEATISAGRAGNGGPNFELDSQR